MLLSGLNILFADDNTLNQKIAEYILKSQSAAVTIAGNGEEVVDHLVSHKEVDIVLLDLKMPIMDGFETARHIRNVLKSDVPIIACSASSEEDCEAECIKAGMDASVPKPFDPKTLPNIILNVLQKHRHRAVI